MRTADIDELKDEQPPSSRAARALWGAVYVLAALVLLAALTLASVALLSPDAWEGPCKRPQLVPPGECSTVNE